MTKIKDHAEYLMRLGARLAREELKYQLSMAHEYRATIPEDEQAELDKDIEDMECELLSLEQ